MDPVAFTMGSASSRAPCPQPGLLPWARGSGCGDGTLTPPTLCSTGKMWVAEGPAPAQWSLRDGAHARHFLATADHLRTAGLLVDVAVGPEGDMAHAVVLASISSFFLRFLESRTRELRQGPPPSLPLPPGATLWGWRAVLAFAYGGTVPHGREKEVEEAARVLGAPRVVAACAPRLESDPQEGGPEPLEEQWETLRAMEQLHASGLGCDLQLWAGDEVIPGEPGGGGSRGVGCPPGGAEEGDRGQPGPLPGMLGAEAPGADEELEVPTGLVSGELGLWWEGARTPKFPGGCPVQRVPCCLPPFFLLPSSSAPGPELLL